MLKNHQEKFLDKDPCANYFQNLISSFLSTDSSLVKFSLRSDQQFLREVANRHTNKQTNKQTDRQTDKRRIKHNFLGGGNYCQTRNDQHHS